MGKSSTDHTGRVAIVIPWISGLMLVGVLISGLRAAAMTDPDALAAFSRIHAAIGVAILVATLALCGSAMLVLSGAGKVLFGAAPGPLPDFRDVPPRYGHPAMALLLPVVHIGAALCHPFILCDRPMARMGVGK